MMALMGFHSIAWKHSEEDSEVQDGETGAMAQAEGISNGNVLEKEAMYFRPGVWGSLLAGLEMRIRGMPDTTAALRKQLSQACPHEVFKPELRKAVAARRRHQEEEEDTVGPLKLDSTEPSGLSKVAAVAATAACPVTRERDGTRAVAEAAFHAIQPETAVSSLDTKREQGQT